MEKLQVHRCSSVEWKPSAVLALASSWDGSQVAVARDGGAVEIWLVSPGSVGWHCQLTIHGDSNYKISSLVWSRPRSKNETVGRLLSSSIDGSVSEWDIFSLKQKKIIDSLGVSIWQLALEPSFETEPNHLPNGKASTDLDAVSNGSDSSSLDSDSDSDSDSVETSSTYIGSDYQRLVMACDDGSVRLYNIPDSDALNYIRSFPRVTGRVLSVTWSHDAKFVYSGSSDGLIRCWDVNNFHELYRITAGLGGINTGPEICIWSLLSLRCGTLVSGDSTGGVQFWDSCHGTLLQAYSHHKGDVNALATAPNHRRVFSAGSDGQVILYKLSNDIDKVEETSKWSYVGYVRAHTHDIRALTMAVPINKEALHEEEKATKIPRREKRIEYSYHKWAHLGIPMLISSGDDTKLFAYSAMEFTNFAPHDICPAPQKPLVHLSNNTNNNNNNQIMVVQSNTWLDVLLVSNVPAQHVMRIQSKELRRLLCSAVSGCGTHVAYSDNVRPCLFNLKISNNNKGKSFLEKVNLPKWLPNACCMVFSADSSYLILAGHNRKIYVVDVKKSQVVSTFVPQRKADESNSINLEPPVTKMFTSFDGQWLAAVNSFGDIYVFNLETQRQHWYVRRMNSASVTAGGFSPRNANVLVVTTSANEVYVFDVEAKQMGEWSRKHTHRLPRRFLEFPGEVIGLSFPPRSSSLSSSVIVYSSRAMCYIDFGMPVNQEENQLPNVTDLPLDEFDTDKLTKLKRKRKNQIKLEEAKQNKLKNFDFCPFKDPVWFVGHLSDGSLFIVEKKWLNVVKTFDAPVHRHAYGS